jgi:hypothetical protein
VSYETLDRAAQYVYPAGIGILLGSMLLLGFWGWQGAFQFGAWLPAILGVVLGGTSAWLAPRLRVLTPIRAHWVRPTATAATSWMGWFSRGLWSLYRFVGRLSNAFSAILEGEGGFMWTLLFMVLFISLIVQGANTP